MSTDKSLKGKKLKLNRTHSMQFRILATIIIAMLAITVFIGGISIYEVDKRADKAMYENKRSNKTGNEEGTTK